MCFYKHLGVLKLSHPVPLWKLKQCTSTRTWCERVRRNLPGNGDTIKLSVSWSAHPAHPHALVPKKWLYTYAGRDIATFLFLTLMYSLVAAIVFVQLAGFSLHDVWLENYSQARYSKQLCGAILSVFFYQTIFFYFLHLGRVRKKLMSYPPIYISPILQFCWSERHQDNVCVSMSMSASVLLY